MEKFAVRRGRVRTRFVLCRFLREVAVADATHLVFRKLISLGTGSKSNETELSDRGVRKRPAGVRRGRRSRSRTTPTFENGRRSSSSRVFHSSSFSFYWKVSSQSDKSTCRERRFSGTSCYFESWYVSFCPCRLSMLNKTK